MRNLKDLYSYDIDINDIKTNSKEVNKNDMFVCVNGNVDRHLYIDEAIRNGAKFLVVSKKGNYKIPFKLVKNANKELFYILNNFYPDASKVNLIGVTGTDGKTTTSTLIKDLLDSCGYVGTNGVEGKKIKDTTDNTTPLIEKTYKYLDNLYKEGNKYVAIEASSEGLLTKRLDGLKFKRAILTNITEDHLNVHKTIGNYIKCKMLLFKKLDKDGVAILNKDDKYYDKFKKIKVKKITYGKSKYSNLRIIKYQLKENETIIEYKYKNKKYVISSKLKGEFNVYNLSAAIATLLSLNYSFDEIIKRIERIRIPSGRCEFLNYSKEFKIVVDYAHTANGINSILEYLNRIKKNRIITVTGAAGGREKENRKEKGLILQEYSSYVIYTMDDPRYEKPEDIINDMIDKNKNNYEVITDREDAIKEALTIAKKDDIVAILGKGRDNYMAIEDKKIPYSDIEVLDKYFNKL